MVVRTVKINETNIYQPFVPCLCCLAQKQIVTVFRMLFNIVDPTNIFLFGKFTSRMGCVGYCSEVVQKFYKSLQKPVIPAISTLKENEAVLLRED